ncbi:hypothetical protein QQ045_002481 [Rhodiola kirilowii]
MAKPAKDNMAHNSSTENRNGGKIDMTVASKIDMANQCKEQEWQVVNRKKKGKGIMEDGVQPLKDQDEYVVAEQASPFTQLGKGINVKKTKECVQDVHRIHHIEQGVEQNANIIGNASEPSNDQLSQMGDDDHIDIVSAMVVYQDQHISSNVELQSSEVPLPEEIEQKISSYGSDFVCENDGDHLDARAVYLHFKTIYKDDAIIFQAMDEAADAAKQAQKEDTGSPVEESDGRPFPSSEKTLSTQKRVSPFKAVSPKEKRSQHCLGNHDGQELMNLSDKCDPRFAEGITAFIIFVKQHKPWRTMHKCPCRRCRLHHEMFSLDEIQTHLFRYGIMQDYTTWTLHGEVDADASSSLYMTQRQHYVMEKSCGTNEASGSYYMDPTLEMLNDAFPFAESHEEDVENDNMGKEAYDKYQRLLAEAHTPIYTGSDKTVLGTILSAMKVKVDNGWSDKSFNDHLRITQDLLPTPNNYPGSYSEVKRLLKNMGMGYEIIHACEYGCVLFYKDYKDLEHCPVCYELRYLDGDGERMIPRRVVRYFPLTLRLQRLYMSPHIAKEMRWHRERKVKCGHIRHPADGEA